MNKLLTASKPVLVTFSLLIGFIGGVIFAVYQAPNFNSQLTSAGQQDSAKPDWQQHIKHLEDGIAEEPNNTKILYLNNTRSSLYNNNELIIHLERSNMIILDTKFESNINIQCIICIDDASQTWIENSNFENRS